MRDKETEISAALWALWLGKDFTFLHNTNYGLTFYWVTLYVMMTLIVASSVVNFEGEEVLVNNDAVV